jgi:D-alanyl-D-alanine carboxypeptidase
MSESDLISDFSAKLDQDTAEDHFSGAVLIAKNGKTIFAQAYGLADRERKKLNTLQTRFRIASMNKMFTAVAILRLVQAGNLRLADPLGKYLTDYPNEDVASKVKIEQLLTHTGGTGDIFGPEFDAYRLRLRTLEDFVKLYGNRGLRFDPGGRWEYSNYGFILLGIVIEKVSGQNYYDYVREHVYVPAFMSSTGSEPEDEPVPGLSVGYTAAPGTTVRPNTGTLPYRRPNTDSLPYRGSSAAVVIRLSKTF